MLNREQPRVLGRLGARELAIEEIDAVTGALAAHTNVCSQVKVGTLTGDGDACRDQD